MAGRVALVTGSTSGIGKGIATAFAREGAAVFVTGMEPELVDPVVESLRSLGAKAAGAAFDLRDVDRAAALVHACTTELGGLDTLVNNAGDPEAARGRDGAIHDTEPDYWDHMFHTILRPGMAVSKAAMPHLQRSPRGGRVVFTGSVMGERGGGWDVYCAFKSAIHGMVRSMALSYARDEITVNAIAVGAVVVEKTAAEWEQEPRRAYWKRVGLTSRPGTPEDIASCALWLGSDEGAFVTGTTVAVDGGMAIRMG